MMDHETKTLSESANGYVGYCACCNRYNVSFNNSLFIFSEEEFHSFRNMMSLRSGLTPFFTTHGKQLIAQTPMRNYYLVFSETEVAQLLDMMIEASLIMETNEILKKHS